MNSIPLREELLNSKRSHDNIEAALASAISLTASTKVKDMIAAAAEIASDASHAALHVLQQFDKGSDEPISIIVAGKDVRVEAIHYMRLMERQKERVDALLLVIKEQQDPGTHSHTLTDLAKSVQEDHGHWYRLQELLGIQAAVGMEADDE